MKLFFGGAFFHERSGKFKDARALRLRELVFVHAQDEDMRKLESLGAVHGHQAHGVAGGIVFEADGAAGLFEIIEILDEFGELARVALVFPLFHEFG